MQAALDRDANGNVVRKAGVMGVVLDGGDIHGVESIRVLLPKHEHGALQPV